MQTAKDLFSYPTFKNRVTKPAPFLPMTRAEMNTLGWDSCDVIVVTGDAYVDHPSFGMAIIGRTLEAQGFRVGIISQPDWESAEPFKELGRPNLFFGVTAGNMDSMINRYTSDLKLRHDDAYTPGDIGGKRPDRAVLVYTQRCKQAFKEVPVVLGGIEASLRRIAHYDYWSDKVRGSVLPDSKADMLIYGNAERPLIEVAHRLASGESIKEITDVRGTSVMLKEPLPTWQGIDSRTLDIPGKIEPIISPYAIIDETCSTQDEVIDNSDADTAKPVVMQADKKMPWFETYIRLPDFETVKKDKMLYAHTSRVFHQETNPISSRALIQKHGAREVWLNPPATPLAEGEMDGVFDLAYARVPHPSYGKQKIPAYDMIKTSINIMRGCFGGCSFCSITEHEGRVIQSRSEDSIVKEMEAIRDKVPGFTGVISDLGGPTANMYKLGCMSPKAEATCRRLSCIFPSICKHMDTDHTPTIDLYRRARKVPGIKKILIASGVRYDLAIEDPRYVKELVEHHVGGYLKIAPEHTEKSPLDIMMKPGMSTYDKFKEMFDRYSAEAGKKQYLIPYFISAHPGTNDEDMLTLALWLKKNKFKLDQVQNFYPSPLANATAVYHTELNSLHKVRKDDEKVVVPKGARQRRLHKSLLRYHDPANWPLIREFLLKSGKRNLIGRGLQHLVPPESLAEKQAQRNSTKPHLGGGSGKGSANSKHKPQTSNKAAKQQRQQPDSKQYTQALTKHTGLAPQEGVGINENGNAKGGKKTNRNKPVVQSDAGGKSNASGKPKNGGFKKPSGNRPDANKTGQGQQAKRSNKR
jgi:uncharacterized radical SAM protein YgiQ